MSMMKVNGIHLNVEVKGDGEPLILIHGLGSDISKWDTDFLRLSKKYKTIALDCRGHGQSDKPKEYTLEDHVQDIISLMDIFKLKTANLYGVSMGSYIAQGVAIAQPYRIKKLILGVTKTNGLTSSTQRLMTEHAEALKILSEQEQQRFLLKYIVHNMRIFLEHPDVLNSSLTPEETIAANKALEHFDYRAELHKISAETLVISGKYDGLNPPDEGKLSADLIPNATFIEMKHSGHLPMLEEQALFSQIIDDFLAK
ncbi:alpha/beta fold hydrolase [Fusibacter ferrireducens]|uniref:Alpha/beta fold hydrolase n=1 Tax=Fusibacter ferrireducens TaxID=2785058 RepID=A0ABR9ZQ53_9FIRM|nr:alpha/beta fold hydrolase [Fusibacter ferrireducens]MBF4692591.1 alpha/beta fold hydrolase [Fusibacter ferrireducens]